MAYCIDLDAKRPEVMLFDGEELEEDLNYCKETDPRKLSDFDRRVFLKQSEAEKYLIRFKRALEFLPYLPCEDSKKSLRLKRHYLVQTWLGEKTYTDRSFKKDWRPGDVFYLHDQTYYVRCMLKWIERNKDGTFRYEYSVII